MFFGGAGRLIADPGASFVGAVVGDAAASDVLELASGSAGSLAGFGTSITNFASLVFDTGAQWTVAGDASANGLGTVGISGFTFGDTIDLAGFAATSETFASNALVLTAGTAHETVHIQGSFTTGNFVLTNVGSIATDITFQTDPLLYGATIDAAGTIAAETVAGGVMTLFNGGGTAVGTIVVGASLSSGDFILGPDGSGGTDVVLDTVFGSYSSGVTLLVDPTTIASTAIVDNAAASVAFRRSAGQARDEPDADQPGQRRLKPAPAAPWASRSRSPGRSSIPGISAAMRRSAGASGSRWRPEWAVHQPSWRGRSPAHANGVAARRHVQRQLDR